MAERQVLRVSRPEAEKLIQFCGYMSTDILSNEKLADKLNVYDDIQPNDEPPAELKERVVAALKHVKEGGKFEVFSEASETTTDGMPTTATEAAVEKPKRGRKPKAEKPPKPPKAEKPPKQPKAPKTQGDRKTAFHTVGAVLKEVGLEGDHGPKIEKFQQVRGKVVPAYDKWYVDIAIQIIQGYLSGDLPTPPVEKTEPAKESAPVESEAAAAVAS